MKFRPLFLLLICGLFSTSALFAKEGCARCKEKKLPETQVISRAFGHLIAKNLNENGGYKFDLQSVICGIQEELEGKPSPLTEAEYEAAISQIQKKVFDEMAVENLSQANDFLEKNAQNEGVTEIIPGKLQVSILKEGNGASITQECTPLVHYTGKYLDETIFGSSEQMDPIALELNETIPGFKEGLIGAKEGEYRRLYVHPDYGYGTNGYLLPNALMIFDIEVLKTNTNSTQQTDS
jgi:peptidylprolyl isomerase